MVINSKNANNVLSLNLFYSFMASIWQFHFLLMLTKIYKLNLCNEIVSFCIDKMEVTAQLCGRTVFLNGEAVECQVTFHNRLQWSASGKSSKTKYVFKIIFSLIYKLRIVIKKFVLQCIY